MTTFLAIVGLALLFVLFGMFRPWRRGSCGNCACDEGTCEREESA